MVWKQISGGLRSVPNAARTLDIDLLDYEGRILEGAVTLPHPRMAGAASCCALAEVAPGWRHP